MMYKKESYILDTFKEIQEIIRSPEYKRLVKETHKNNVMLKQIIKVINIYIARHHQENEDDFNRNVFANMISCIFDLGNIIKHRR